MPEQFVNLSVGKLFLVVNYPSPKGRGLCLHSTAVQRLEEQRAKLGEYMDGARAHARALDEVWQNPAVAEAQGLLAGVLRRTEEFSERIGRIAQLFRATAAQAEEEQRRRRQEEE